MINKQKRDEPWQLFVWANEAGQKNFSWIRGFLIAPYNITQQEGNIQYLELFMSSSNDHVSNMSRFLILYVEWRQRLIYHPFGEFIQNINPHLGNSP